MSKKLCAKGSLCLLLMSPFFIQTAQADDIQLKDQVVDEATHTANANGPETDHTLTEDTTYETIYGGKAAPSGDVLVYTANANSNTVDMTKVAGVTAANIFGGHATGNAAAVAETAIAPGTYEKAGIAGVANASGNTVVFNEGTATQVAGGYSEAVYNTTYRYVPYAADGNPEIETFSDGETYYIYKDVSLTVTGGTATAHADNNNVVSAGTVTDLYGGHAVTDGSGIAVITKGIINDTTFTISPATAIFIGSKNEAYADGNTVTSNNGTATNVYGGLASARDDLKSEVIGWYNATAKNTGGTTKASAKSNTVTFNDGKADNVYGGKAVAESTVYTYTNVEFRGDDEHVSSSSATAGTVEAYADSNTVTLNKGQYKIAAGGYAEADEKSSPEDFAVDGGTSTASAKGNTVTVSGAEVSDTMYGGYARANANATGEQLGGTAKAYAQENTVLASGGTAGSVYGGRVLATWLPELQKKSDQSGDMTGAGGTVEARADSNTVTLSDGKYTMAAGGYAEAKAEATPRDGASDDPAIVNGASSTASAKNNTVTLTRAEVSDKLYGGYACASLSVTGEKPGQAEAHADGNTVTLVGGSFSGSALYTGYSELSGTFDADTSALSAKNNTLVLSSDDSGNAPSFGDNTVLYGGMAVSSSDKVTGDTSGNTLKFNNVTGMKAANIKNFQNLEYEYKEMKANEVILELSGTDNDKKTSIAGGTVSVSVGNLLGADDGEFKTGDKVVLLKNENGLVTDGITTKATFTATTGISLKYEVEIQTDEENTELVLTRTDTKPDESDDDGKTDDDDSGKTDDGGKTDNNTDNSGNRDKGDTVQPGTKAIAEGAAAGLALVNESSNAAIELLRDFSLASGSVTPFVHVQASSMRHQTGSSINVSAVSLLAGLGTGIDTGAGNLSLGAFFEYGKGSYTTHNSFSNYSDVDGDGNSWYMGGGILAKMDFVQTGPGHFYAEGSAHMGTLHNEFDSNDLFDANGNVAKFDMDSPYYSLHGGIGYVWNMGCGHDLDVYGKYIWTRVQGTDDTLTTKDRFDYDNMDSNRVRFGARYSYTGSERFKPYVGAAFEHEFSGSCDSRAFGYRVAAPSFEGSSGMGELGLVMKPSADLPLSVNLGVQGYVGQKQGISGSCNAMYEF